MSRPRRPRPAEQPAADAPLRIIGGTLRGRRLPFAPDPRTRPMKDRVRETLFDLLGPAVRGCVALDLFAGSGAIAFEALSRGAARAILVERHFPTADRLREAARELGVADRVDVRSGDTLVWARRLPADLPRDAPWVVFISPPWPLFAERPADLMALVAALGREPPAGSTLVVESDARFDPAALPDAAAWRSRSVLPAVLHMRSGLVS
jgi:16S rRNA (guanine966-N2)-methyltransferase